MSKSESKKYKSTQVDGLALLAPSLVFQPLLKQALVSTILLEHDLRVNKEIMENPFFKTNVVKILMKLCVVVNLRYCVKVLTFWKFSQIAKNFFRALHRNHSESF